ncbi:single-stranded-DNA-specific exonuclease RecJ [Pelagibius marinus]|uniref:single-stranded-DNA-specific exonuclease RecJ n=1 Tax=Pelagibius marinus TaxID=2762760 RepID=UPI0018723782|nr:single-stranded-DNA-specific exonuclease RecJ [Pelagibius marinus]
MTPRGCFLGVERSLTGKRWEERLADSRLGLALSQQLGLPEVVGRVLAARGVQPEEAERFLNPTLRDYLPDPSAFMDMDRAAARLLQAVEAGEKVAVFGDYDVDGATSSAVLARFFAALGVELQIYIPDRLAEGYGPNAPALKRLKDQGVTLVITVDCGITAFEALGEAAAAGLEIIVVDHHAAEPRLPPAAAVVNPNRLDDTSGQGQLAAVGVAFLLVVALNRALREAGWYARNDRPEPDLRQWLDLVALGTVCDVVPLTGVNRALVAQGLKVMAARGNVGLSALSDVSRIDEKPGTYHAGFLLGPRVNAGGRVGESPLGARLLTCDDPGEAAALAARLDGYNAERREIELQVLDQAIRQVEEAGPGEGLVVAASEGWHAGVIGIVASRLKERFNKPALVVALENGIGKGSARSVPGVDLGAAVIAARQEGLLVNGGGHPMAAGLTVAAENLAELTAFLDARLARRLAEIDYQPALGIDGALKPKAATLELLAQLDRCAPFGVGNTQPRFALPSVKVAKASVVGENHVRCFLGDSQGAGGGSLKGIAFRALDSDLGPALLQTAGLPLHVAGRLQIDRWGGRESVQFIIEDAAPVSA